MTEVSTPLDLTNIQHLRAVLPKRTTTKKTLKVIHRTNQYYDKLLPT